MKTLQNFNKLIRKILSHTTILSLIVQQILFVQSAAANNLPIKADGTTNTQVTKTASGIDQINIAAPNSSGVSHNKFVDYNVNKTGQILNNFSGTNATHVAAGSGANAVTNTQIAGLVGVNNNLVKSGGARVILNEVTSANVTKLLGYTEIAGRKANLIIANPNGITCNGCGFINTARLLMIAGSSEYNQHGNLDFNLKKQNLPNVYVPLITIDGLGLDATRTNSTDIIASSVKVLSSIYGSDNTSLTIKAGEGKYNYLTKKISGPEKESPDAAIFAIDVSALAKIHAGQVYLIATQKGVGVNMAGEIVASSTLEIDANGDIHYNKLYSGNEATLKSDATIKTINQDSELSSKAVNISANKFENLGLVSANNIDINNSLTLDNQGYLIGKNLNLSNISNIHNSGEITSFGTITVTDNDYFENRISGIMISNLETNMNSESIKNDGSISSNSALNITSSLLENNSNISSVGNLYLILHGNLTNNGILESITRVKIESDSDIDNSNKILSAGTLDIIISDTHNDSEAEYGVVNSGTIKSNNKMTLDVNSLNNSGEIVSNEHLDIDATGEIKNNNRLESLALLTINADSLINNSLIKSGQNIDISAKYITNNATEETTNVSSSSSSARNGGDSEDGEEITSGIASVSGNVTILTDNLNNDSGIIYSNKSSVDSLSSDSVNFSNLGGAFMSTESISLDLGDTDHEITGYLTATNVDITANNITNKGNVVATDFIKLNATGTDGVSGSGNITNGYKYSEGKDNEDVQLVAGSYINLMAQNSIINYGTISAITDLTLTSEEGIIRNYSNIIGGNGNTIINVNNGSFLNSKEVARVDFYHHEEHYVYNDKLNPKITANGDLEINSQSLFNDGEISVANDLVVNVSKDLFNMETASIWSGNDATFNVKDWLINTKADIYSKNNLTIQRGESGARIGSLVNTSGNIETHLGDLTIKANNLSNKRSSMKTQGHSYTDHAWYQQHETHHNSTHTALINGTAGVVSNIFSGNNMVIDAVNITNDASNISAEGNINIKYLSKFLNKSYSFESYYQAKNNWWCGGTCVWNGDWNNVHKQNYRREIYSGTIKSGGSLLIRKNNVNVTSSFLNGNTVVQNSDISGNKNISKSTAINNVEILKISQEGIDLDLSSIVDVIEDKEGDQDSIFSGNFKINLDPSSTKPLIEARSKFVDPSEFFGSSYYFDLLGLDGDAVIANIDKQTRSTDDTRHLGDSYVEHKLIIDSIKTLTNDSLFLSQGVTDSKAQVKELIKNAVAELANQDLDATQVALNGLTAQQIAALEDDIVTFELTEIKGINVLAPKIYLGSNTRTRLLGNSSTGLANSSTIYGQNGVNIEATSTNLTNNGSIRSGADLTIGVASLNNETNSPVGAQIIAANNLIITAHEENINNIGAQIKSGNLTKLTAAKEINNKAIVRYKIDGKTTNHDSTAITESQALASGARNISSQLVAKGNIESGGNLVLSAGNDINIKASTLNSTGDTHLSTTSGNVNIQTATLREKTHIEGGGKKKGFVKVTDKTTNIGSEINSTGNLTISSGADINIQGSKLTSSDNLTLSAKEDVKIVSAQDSSYSHASGRTGNGKSYSQTATSTTQVESELHTSNNGNISINSGVDNTHADGSISVIASKLTTTDTDHDSSNNVGSGDINLVAKENIVIASALNSKYEESSSSRKTTTVKRSNKSIKESIKNVKSELDSSGDINTSSGGNTILIASDLTSDNDTNIKVGSYINSSNEEIINDGATLNILNGKDSEYSYTYASKVSKDAGAIAVGMAVGFATGGFAGMAAGAYIGSQQQKGNVHVVETYDETIVSSNLNAGNNINIEVASDTLVRSSNLNAGNESNIRVGSITNKDGNIVKTNNNANLNISSDTEKHVRNEHREKIKPDLVAVAAASALSGTMISMSSGLAVGQIISVGNVVAVGGTMVARGTKGNVLTNKNIQDNGHEEHNQVSSNISSLSNIDAISANNINIVASNVASGEGDINLTSGGETNILSALETSTSYSRTEHQDLNDYDAGIDRGRASVGVNVAISKETSTTNKSTVKSSNISAKNVSINSGDDVTIQASNIIAEEHVEVTSEHGDVNLVSAQNTTKNTKISEDIEATLSVGIGNAYVDAAYVADDAVKAGEAVKEAKDELSHMKNLRNQGRATDEAVKDSKINLALALANFKIAVSQAKSAVHKASGAASTSLGTGFYADARLSMSNTKSTSNESIVENVASNIISGGNISLVSNDQDLNITGSNIASLDGNVHLEAGNDVNIQASKDSYNYKFGSETINSSLTIASSNPSDIAESTINIAAGLGFQKSDQSISSITYNNSAIDAKNIEIISGNDTMIKGANLLASEDIEINVGNDLLVASLQNEYHGKGSSKGFNLGVGINVNSSGEATGGNASIGFNRSNSRTDRVWVDNQTSIIGTESVTINTNNNTNIKGALIANIKEDGTDGGNLILTTNTLTFEDIKDSESHYQSSFGANLAMGISDSHKVSEQSKKTSQSGLNLNDTKVTFSTYGYDKEQMTRATVGNGAINVSNKVESSDLVILNRDINKSQEIVKDTIHSNLKGEVSAQTVVEIAQFAYAVSPMGISEAIEDYTGHELTWKKGKEATFKEKGREYETLDPNANNIGLANTIDLVEYPERAYLIGQPLSADPTHEITRYSEGSAFSNAANVVPGLNSVLAIPHDKFGNKGLASYHGPLQLSIIPFLPIGYYGIVGKSIRNIYEKKNNN